MARRTKDRPILGTLKAIGSRRIIAVLILAIVGCWLSAILAVSGVVRNKSPQVALMMIPTESSALAAQADLLLFANAADPPRRVFDYARAALQQQSLNPRAVRLLGFMADFRGDRARALALVKMAAKLSRRDQGAQLWLIEYYAQSDDTKQTLHHYDVLLTTRPSNQPLLFPRLSDAIEDASIRAALVPYVRKNKGWTNDFVSHAISNDKDSSNVLQLIVEANGLPKSGSSQVQLSTLLERLVNQGRFDDALRLYRLVPGAQSARLVDPAFAAPDTDRRFGPMGWLIPDDPNAGGGFVGLKGEAKPTLSVFASPATTKTVASRLLYLKPGSYRFSSTVSQFERGDGGYLLFRIRCPAAAKPEPVWTLNASLKSNADRFDIPADCPAQFLEIVASGGQGQLGLEATINEVSISR